jgi:hypothetical protein
MSLRLLHKTRRVGGVIALVGMVFYAMLFPWHTVSQTTLLLAQAGVGTSIIPICHREATGEPAKPAQPTKQTHCPICNGFAAPQLALTSPPISLSLPTELVGKLLHSTEADLAEASGLTPHNRGPPSLSA